MFLLQEFAQLIFRFYRVWLSFFGLQMLLLPGPSAKGSDLQQQSENWSPVWFWRAPDLFGRPARQGGLGPLISHRPSSTSEVFSLRPIFAEFEDQNTLETRSYLAFPFFSSKVQKAGGCHWDFFDLIIGEERTEPEGFRSRRFEVWPLFWQIKTASPETSYWALAPLYGKFKQRFWADRIQFVLFPLYLQYQRKDETTTSVFFPIFQWLEGPRSDGFEFWPLFGYNRKIGTYDHHYWLWPFFYHYVDQQEGDEPIERLGLLPFYASESAAGMRSKTYLWPFFGYTTAYAPRKSYEETRYFWPFFVQGRGEDKYINRWLPFYTHEKSSSLEKWWYAWPLLKQTQRYAEGLHIERDQVLYFLWLDERQTAGSFRARKTHLWPLFSYWNNGNGERQWQTLSPLEVFFPNQEAIREKWSPLFAIYRYDEKPGSRYHGVLWDLIAVENRGSDGVFQVGPLFELIRTGEDGYFEILHGLFAFGREDGKQKRKIFWMEW